MCTLRAAVISALDFALVEAANGNALHSMSSHFLWSVAKQHHLLWDGGGV